MGRSLTVQALFIHTIGAVPRMDHPQLGSDDLFSGLPPDPELRLLYSALALFSDDHGTGFLNNLGLFNHSDDTFTYNLIGK